MHGRIQGKAPMFNRVTVFMGNSTTVTMETMVTIRSTITIVARATRVMVTGGPYLVQALLPLAISW